MEPIINPLWLYLADISGAVSKSASAIFIMGVCLLLFMTIAYKPLKSDMESCPIRYKTAYILVASTTVIALLISILLPSRETVYAMIAANAITPESLANAKQGTASILQDILNMVQSLK